MALVQYYEDIETLRNIYAGELYALCDEKRTNLHMLCLRLVLHGGVCSRPSLHSSALSHAVLTEGKGEYLQYLLCNQLTN